MRVSKSQLINGFVDYIETEVIPQVEDKPTQIIVSVAAKAVKANPALADTLLGNSMLKALLDENEDGYEIGGLFASLKDSIKQYGPFPIDIPPIPLISPVDKTLTFTESDVSELQRRIERGSING